MTSHTVRLSVVTASVRAGRLGPVVTGWFRDRLRERDDVSVDEIDLAALDLPTGLDGSGDTAEYLERIARADGFVIVTPEYNHGYPGSLKTAIDTALDEWKIKPAGFVSYGGLGGGLRAVEQLRTVFAELQVVTTRRTVSISDAEDRFDDRGRLTRPDRLDAAATSMIDELTWWAHHLRRIRLSPATT